MASEHAFDEFRVNEIIEGITAFVSAPVVLTVAAGVKQPFVQAAIKEGVALSERLREAIAETGEIIEDLTAEAKAGLAEERQQELTRTRVPEGQSHGAAGINNFVSTLNEHTGRMTQGVADLRLLMSLGLGAVALRQLIVKGLELDEIPWYTLAWYAFDSFGKLNQGYAPPTPDSGAASQPVGEGAE
jgi:hypothetical protein